MPVKKRTICDRKRGSNRQPREWMDQPVRGDCVKSGIREQDVEPAAGGGIALERRAQVGEQGFPGVGHSEIL